MGNISTHKIKELTLDEQTLDLHQESVVIDLHVDSLLSQRLINLDITQYNKKIPFTLRALPFIGLKNIMRLFGHHQPFFNHADIPRMGAGGYDGVGLGLHYWPKSSEKGWNEINAQIDIFDHLLQQSDDLIAAIKPEDIENAHRENKLAAFLGLEGLHGLGESGKKNETKRLDRIETLYRRGVRYITFAHFSKNDVTSHNFGINASDRVSLSNFGHEVVKKMNDVGMIIDLAHTSHRTILDVCEYSTAPVMASHTGFISAQDVNTEAMKKRNLSDEAILAIAQTGGVCGMIFAPYFLKGDSAPISAVVKHLNYARTLLANKGLDPDRHLAIGSDFDGWITPMIEDINGADDLPLLTQALVSDNWAEKSIKGTLGNAFLEMWKKIR